jgi:hypothetical protein
MNKFQIGDSVTLLNGPHWYGRVVKIEKLPRGTYCQVKWLNRQYALEPDSGCHQHPYKYQFQSSPVVGMFEHELVPTTAQEHPGAARILQKIARQKEAEKNG